VYTSFQHQPHPGLLAALRDETSTILARLGVRVEWRTLDKVRANEVWVEVAVVTFKGGCDDSGAVPPARPSRRLGWTHVTDGEVLPFAEVDCGLVRSFLAPQLIGVERKEAGKKFARAVGRVVAHELYHILGRTTHHSARGVDQPAYTAQELVSDRFLLEESPYQILRRGAIASQAGGTRVNGSSLFRDRGCTACHGAGAEGTRNGPALRAVGRFFSTVGLAARLGIGAKAMVKKANRLKVPLPSVDESEIALLVQFLNTVY
jgi:cytochrome c551/c552